MESSPKSVAKNIGILFDTNTRKHTLGRAVTCVNFPGVHVKGVLCVEVCCGRLRFAWRVLMISSLMLNIHGLFYGPGKHSRWWLLVIITVSPLSTVFFFLNCSTRINVPFSLSSSVFSRISFSS